MRFTLRFVSFAPGGIFILVLFTYVSAGSPLIGARSDKAPTADPCTLLTEGCSSS